MLYLLPEHYYVIEGRLFSGLLCRRRAMINSGTSIMAAIINPRSVIPQTGNAIIKPEAARAILSKTLPM